MSADLALCTLVAQPPIAVALTGGCYLAAVRLSRLCRSSPIVNSTFVSIVLLAILLKAGGVEYAAYAQAANSLSFALSAAVVLLAVPLFRQREVMRDAGLAIIGALASGMPVGALSAVAIAWTLGADHQTLLSLAPKSTTAGVAMSISERIGGFPALTAVLVIMTGIIGAVLAPFIAWLMRIRDPRAIGLALGITSHGIGTARALQVSDVMGAFSGLGMALNAVASAIVLPLAVLALRLT